MTGEREEAMADYGTMRPSMMQAAKRLLAQKYVLAASAGENSKRIQGNGYERDHSFN